MKKNLMKVVSLVFVLVLSVCCTIVLSACNEEETDAFKSDTRFYIDNETTDFMGQINGKTYLPLIETLALNMDETYFEFGKDGMLHMQIQTKDGLFGSVESLLKNSIVKNLLGDIDVESMLESVDLTQGIEFYVEPMFPGFAQKIDEEDFEGALELIRRSLGFNIVGLDYNDEGVKQAVAYVAQNKALPGNLLSLIPADTVLKLTLDTEYSIRHLTGADGKQYDAIYLGYDVKENPSTTPFAVFTMTEDDGVTKLLLRLEFMDIDIGLTQNKA